MNEKLKQSHAVVSVLDVLVRACLSAWASQAGTTLPQSALHIGTTAQHKSLQIFISLYCYSSSADMLQFRVCIVLLG